MDETFNTKAFHWPLNNVNVRIILQNKNGPCPLISLLNGLVLNNHAQALSFMENKQTVKLHDLLEFLGNLLLTFDSEQQQNFSSSSGGDSSSSSSIYEDINQVLNVLPQLNTGLNVDPLFLHDNDAHDEWFENEPHDLAIFKIFDIKIVHGWLMDPATLSDYKTVKNKIRSFDNYQLLSLQDSNALADSAGNEDFRKGIQDVAQFLQRYPSQLSDYGLEYLLKYFAHTTSASNGNAVKIIFRNNHFSTVFYNPLVNQLFTLVTDSSLIDGNLVWQSLSSVTGNLDLFYDENFLPSTSDGTHINNNSASIGAPATTPTDTDSADLKLAQSLQLEEDEILAKQVDQQQRLIQKQRQQQRRSYQQQQQTIGQATRNTGNGARKALTQNDWQRKRDKKCIIC